jgi:ribosome-associated toxin RatA of RatAB toxin-antitoxin module
MPLADEHSLHRTVSLKIQERMANLKARFFADAMGSSRVVAAAATMLISILSVVSAAQGAPADLETPSLSEETLNGKTYTVSHILVHATQDSVWRVLTDYKNAPKVFPQLKHCEIVENKGNVKVMKHQVNPMGLACASYQYVIEVQENPPKSLEWHRVSGDFKAVDGFWKLDAANGGRDTMVTYSSYVNGGFFIPQMLIRRQFHIEMPNVLSNLKNETESVIIAKKSDSSRTQ